MALQLGQTAPDFEQDSTDGRIHFHQWLGGSWGVLFSHPKDFTPVCTTELGAVAALKPEWDARDVKVIGLSVDPAGSHAAWAADIAETQGHALNFPLIADADRSVATLYDMVHPEADPAVTVRSVFIIDPAKKVRLTMMYPASTGRNTSEVLRVIDSLQTGDKKGVTTPIDWQVGDDVIVPPTVSTPDARKKFQDVKEIRPYLRFTSGEMKA